MHGIRWGRKTPSMKKDSRTRSRANWFSGAAGLLDLLKQLHIPSMKPGFGRLLTSILAMASRAMRGARPNPPATVELVGATAFDGLAWWLRSIHHGEERPPDESPTC